MSTGRIAVMVFTILLSSASSTRAQRSSIGARAREEQRQAPQAKPPREERLRPLNAVYEHHSWITATPRPPRTYRPGDLLTIIIRERRQWEAESDLNTKKKYDLTSEIEAFLKLTRGGLGATEFQRGRPDIGYAFEQKLRSDADSSREDSLTTRLTAKVIDVKPNGLLVLEGRAQIIHDDEVSGITITGTCRKEDVTADNTVLSTQIADKSVVVTNAGALRAASSRGWIPRIIDLLRPI
jgi:flagellar L-ring protein precursor FlgH